MSNKHCYTIASISVLLLFNACKPGEIDLRLKPLHKSRYEMLFNTEGKVNMSFAGKDFSTDVHTGISGILDIDTLANDRFQFKLMYDDYNLQQEVAGKKVDLKDLTKDSSGSANTEDFIKGLVFYSELNRTGKVDKISDSKDVTARLDTLLKDMPQLARTQLTAAIAPVFSSDMAKGMLDKCFYVFPNKQVNIGDSWTNEILMQSIFSMLMKSKFTLVEIKDSIAQLKVHSDIYPGKQEVLMPGLAMAAPKGADPGPLPGGLDLMGMKMNATFEGTEDGNVWINMKTGMVIKNVLMQDLKGKISISIIDLPMTMKMTTGFRVEPLN